MARFASGKNAYGISDRSGFRYRLSQMRKEWNGLLVGLDEYEEKHPQLTPPRNIFDPQAIKNARPDRTEPAVQVLLNFHNVLLFLQVIPPYYQVNIPEYL